MIVIAIIAILAAILIPNFLHARAEAQTSGCEGNEKQIATALEEYDHNGTYGAGGMVTSTLLGTTSASRRLIRSTSRTTASRPRRVRMGHIR